MKKMWGNFVLIGAYFVCVCMNIRMIYEVVEGITYWYRQTKH